MSQALIHRLTRTRQRRASSGLLAAAFAALLCLSLFAAPAWADDAAQAMPAGKIVATSQPASVAPSHPHVRPHGFLGLNWWGWDSHRPPMGWFLLDFFIFVGLLGWVSHAPLKKVFSGRHEHVKRTIAQAAQAHAKASHAHHDVRRRLAAMEAEIRELENSTVQDGEAERAQMVGAAESYAARLRAESQRQADQQVKRSEEHLRRRVLSQVIRTAERQVARIIQPDDHTRLIDEAIDRLASQGPKGSTRMAKPAAIQGGAS